MKESWLLNGFKKNKDKNKRNLYVLKLEILRYCLGIFEWEGKFYFSILVKYCSFVNLFINGKWVNVVCL